MSLKALIKLIPPPARPIDNEGDWRVAEREFGTALPTDFKNMVSHYGTGEFKLKSLRVANPLTEAGRSEIRNLLSTLRQLRDAMELALVIHPETPGLLPWGMDHNGNMFCWWTKGAPEKWSIAQVGHDEEETPHVVKVDITSFLVKYAQNEYPEMQGGLKFSESHQQFEQNV